MDGKRKIIEAAARIISEQGISNATVRLIAEEAGISTGAIYYYYASKEEILADLFDQKILSLSEARQNNNEAGEPSLNEGLALLKKLENTWDKTQIKRLYLFLAQEAILGNDDLNGRFAENYTVRIQEMEEYLQSLPVDVPEGTRRGIAMLIIAALDGIAFQSLLDNHPLAWEECREGAGYLLDILLSAQGDGS